MLASSQIPLDAWLPQLAEVANEEFMATLFTNFLAPGWKLVRCRIKEARYYPGSTCLLAYHLKCAAESGELQTLTLYARAFGPESVPESFRTREPLGTVVGALPAFLPEQRLALWTFPDDPGVRGLAEVWREGGRLTLTPGLLQLPSWAQTPHDIDVTLVSYVPSKRAILRYDCEDHGSAESFFGKVYAVEDARLLFENMQRLWDYSQRRAPELSLARPLGCDESLKAVWQASPGGESLLEALAGLDLPQTMRRVAAALAALHRSDVRPERHLTVREETIKLERARAALTRFYPMLQPQIDQVLGSLIAHAVPEPARLAPVHGDFHCNQVLVQDERVAIIDFDLFSLGDPSHDVARFLSRFRAYAQGKLSETVASRAQEAFLTTYEILVPWRVERERLAWMMAALHVNRQALKSVKKLSAGGPEPVVTLLDAAWNMARGKDL